MSAIAIRSAAVRRIVMWSLIAAILITPLMAMQFTREVRWTGLDFAFAAVLLGGAGLTYELVERMTVDARRRLLAAAVLLAAVLVIWAEGAVGIF
jgi:hypothetical protein